MKKIILLMLLMICVSFATFNVTLGDQMDNLIYNVNGSLVESADVTILIYTTPTGGSPIYNETFVNAIQNGSSNVMLGENPSIPLSLNYLVTYYKDILIENEDLDFVYNDGSIHERRSWMASLGQIQASAVNETMFDANWDRNVTDGFLYPTISSDNLIITENVSASYFIGDGSLLTNLPTNPITKLIYVDGNRVDVYVEDGTRAKPFKTIQAGINSASAGMMVLIENKVYNENIILKAGVKIRSRAVTTYYGGVKITGKVTYSSGAGRVELAGIYVYNTMDHALELLGTDAMKLDCYNCKFETNSNGLHHAIFTNNTNSGSEIFMRNSLVQVLDSSGGAKCIDTDITSALTIGVKDTTIRIVDDTDNVAIDLDGAVNYWHTLDVIGGRVIVSTGASSTISLCSMTSATQPVLTTNSAGLTILSNVMATTTSSPAVTGVGAFAYSGVSYASTGQGLASTLNGGFGATIGAIPFDSASNVLYDNTTSGLTSTLVKTAIDELTGMFGVDFFWNITGSEYLFNNSGILEVNETKLNETIALNNYWNLWGSTLYPLNTSHNLGIYGDKHINFYVDGIPKTLEYDTTNNRFSFSDNLNIGNLLSGLKGLLLSPTASAPSTNDGTIYYDDVDKKFYFRQNGVWEELGSGAVDTFWNITGSNYLYNNSGILEVNETKLNETIALTDYWTESGGTIYPINLSKNIGLSGDEVINFYIDGIPKTMKYDTSNNRFDLNDNLHISTLLTGLKGLEFSGTIVAPSTNDGTIFYNNTPKKFYFRQNGVWEELGEVDTIWNITGSNYLFNNSGILEVNETALNNTIESFNYLTNGTDAWFTELNSTGNLFLTANNYIDFNQANLGENYLTYNSSLGLAYMRNSTTLGFLISEAGTDLASYHPRSFMIGGSQLPAGNLTSDMNNCTAQGYNHIDCATGTTGADLGIQDELEVKGNIFVGDAENYTQITNDGKVILFGEARVTKQISLYPYNIGGIAGTYNGVACASAGLGSLNGMYFKTFDKIAEESINVAVQLPYDYVNGTNITIEIKWATGGISGNVTWQGGLTNIAEGDTYNPSTYIWATPQTIIVPTTAWERDTLKFVLSGSGIAGGDDLSIIAFRDTLNNDDYNGDVYVSLVALEYTSDRIGA